MPEVDTEEMAPASEDTDNAPADAAPAPPAEVAAVEEPVAATVVVTETPAVRDYPSLYDSVGTTVVAIVLGIVIVGGIQLLVARIFAREPNPHRALTQFVTAMVAIMVGVYVSDMLIAGPTAELLGESERGAILGFVKDTALMIFAYYFGTQAGKENT
jgi:cbb3-type cytochrome oxidase subunit 1